MTGFEIISGMLVVNVFSAVFLSRWAQRFSVLFSIVVGFLSSLAESVVA